jgi:hypothetical protein
MSLKSRAQLVHERFGWPLADCMAAGQIFIDRSLASRRARAGDPEDARALALRALGYSYRDIAHQLGLASTSGVWPRIRRALPRRVVPMLQAGQTYDAIAKALCVTEPQVREAAASVNNT